MATYYSQTGNSSFSPFLLLSIFVTFYLLLLGSTIMTSVKAESFVFTQFHSGETELSFQGDAIIDDKNRCLVLTREEGGSPAQNSVGRVLYKQHINLINTQNLHEASFKTSFTFYNYRVNKDKAGDGLAFFFAPINSKPKHVAAGLLGIFSEQPSLQSNEDEDVVAVEFDSFSNTWDPKDPHIGIDVHSITSRITKPWPLKNDYVTVSITYEASSHFLNVSAFYRESPTDIYTLSTKVSLKDSLPRQVQVGFSATTGELTEQHRVYSWFFSSEFPRDSSTTKGFKNPNLLTNYVEEA